MTEELTKPRLVRDLLMEDGERKTVGAMVFAETQVADWVYQVYPRTRAAPPRAAPEA